MTSLRVGRLGYPGNGATSIYDLVSGWLYVSGSLTLEAYQAGAAFNQYGGTNFAGTLQLTPYPAHPLTIFTGHVLRQFRSDNGGCQWQLHPNRRPAFITNTLTIQGENPHANTAWTAYYELFGGTLSVGRSILTATTVTPSIPKQWHGASCGQPLPR